MKTDADLKRSVIEELDWDPAINATAVGVSVKDGVVTLTGHLDSYGEKFAIEKALRRVAGVKAIALELDIKLAPQHKRSDTEIASAARAVLAAAHFGAFVDGIQVKVESGWVTLTGEVEWNFQRVAIESVLRPLKGVVGLSDQITIRQRPTKADLGTRIEEALRRQAAREAHRIDVSIDGNTVTLRGKVHSWHERDAAEGVAWSAPGVRAVINEVQVGL